MNAASGSIDGALEQVAKLFADGLLDQIEPLLEIIIANGDELQKQMGKMYREQLILFRAEEESAIAAESPILIESEPDSIETKADSLSDIQLSQDEVILENNAEPHNDDGHVLLVGCEENEQISLPEQMPQFSEDILTTDEHKTCQPDSIFNSEDVLSQQSIQHTSTDDHKLQSADSVTEHQTIYPDDSETQSIEDGSPQVQSNMNARKTSSTSTKQTTTNKIHADNPRLHILVELILKRAVALIKDDYAQACKLLNRVIEIGTPEQKKRAQEYLTTKIDNSKAEPADTLLENNIDKAKADITIDNQLKDNYNTESVSSNTNNAENILQSQAGDTIRDKPVNLYSTQEVLSEQKLILPTLEDTTDIGLLSAQTTPLPMGNTEWVPPPFPTTESHASDTIFNSTIGLDNSHHPSEILQTHYNLDVLPSQTEDKNITLYQRQGFHVGEIALMIDFADGSELMDMPITYRVPNAPRWLVGLTNIHSVIIPVFDLVGFFRLTPVENQKNMLLILGHGDNAIGIVIAGLPQRLQWQQSQVVDENTAPTRLRRCIRTACLINNELWFELDCTALSTNLKTGMRL